MLVKGDAAALTLCGLHLRVPYYLRVGKRVLFGDVFGDMHGAQDTTGSNALVPSTVSTLSPAPGWRRAAVDRSRGRARGGWAGRVGRGRLSPGRADSLGGWHGVGTWRHGSQAAGAAVTFTDTKPWVTCGWRP